MKPIVFIIASCLLPLALFCQTTEYFTADWKKTKNKDKAYYYRIVTYDQSGQPAGVVKDFYMSGQVQWMGRISFIDNSGNETRQGWCTWFYQNGKMQQQSFYWQGMLDSTTYYWNENGDLIGEEDYKNNVLHGAYIRYFPNKKPRLVAVYVNGRLKDNLYLEYDENGIPVAVYPEFFDNAGDWTLFNGKDYSSEIKNKKLWLGTKTTKYRTCGYKHVPLNGTNNFSIEAVVTLEKGSNDFKSHGIIWGVKDELNYDYFLISNEGTFQTGYVQNGNQIKTLPWTISTAIKPGKSQNNLKVIKAGGQYIYVVNEQAVATAPYQAMMGSNAGVILGSGMERIYCDRFIVQQELGTAPMEKNPPAANGSIAWNVSGSGILIDKNGFIATNEHVIQGAQKIEVEFVKDNKKYTFNAEVVKADAIQDLAILKINDPKYNAFKPAALPYGITTKLLDIGASVFALGYPEMWKLGKNIKFSDGKISAQTGEQDNPYWYQITVPIQHGNSGGPLFDNDGNLVGLTNAGWETMDNVAYAIKSSLLIQMLSNSFPGKYIAPVNTIKEKPLTEKIKVLKSYVPLIKVKVKEK